MRKNSVKFPPRESTRAETTGRLDIPKQDEMCFFFNAKPVLLAMQNGAKQWSHFPTLSFSWLSPNAMLWWRSSRWWNFFCRITMAPFTYVYTVLGLFWSEVYANNFNFCTFVYSPCSHTFLSVSSLRHPRWTLLSVLPCRMTEAQGCVCSMFGQGITATSVVQQSFTLYLVMSYGKCQMVRVR